MKRISAFVIGLKDWFANWLDRLFGIEFEPLEWNVNDQREAAAQGWALGDLWDHGTREFELALKRTLPGHFASDYDAWKYVVRAYNDGDPLAVKALAILSQESPNEFALISRFTGLDADDENFDLAA